MQDYRGEAELVILDDRQEPSFPGGIVRPRVRYFASTERNIAAKRNACCGVARGEAICHWDSDDYSAPSRLSVQVERLEATRADVTGFRAMRLYDDRKGLWYQHSASESVFGTSLLYRRSWWEAHPFDESRKTAEDYAFYMAAARQGRASFILDAGFYMAARIHDGNTAKKNPLSFRSIEEPDNEPLRQWAYGAVLAR